MTPFSVSGDDAQDAHDAVRCFKCPRERQEGEPGWHFLDPSKLRGTLRRGIVHVCPAHYGQFAVAERTRWEPLFAPVFPSDCLSAPPPESGVETPLPPAGAPANVPAAESQLTLLAGSLLLPAPATAAS